MTFAVFRSEPFQEKLRSFPNEFQKWVEKIEGQLAENPYAGDPIKADWFREKKRGKYRVYYVIYSKVKAVYMVAISEKKDQQKTINTITLVLDELGNEVKNLVK